MDRFQNRSEEDFSGKETLYMLSGVALMVFGAGLILTNQTVRKHLGQLGVGGLVQSAVPDLERYLRLRAM
jgi:hypothetical protein